MKTLGPWTKRKQRGLLIFISVMMAFAAQNASAQAGTAYMRMAKITIDSTKLDPYIVALKEQMQSALRFEKGVLAYSAVQDKNNPTKITILETYASVAAYQEHIQTEHFKKYKAAVADMVQQLELIDVVPIAIQSKPK